VLIRLIRLEIHRLLRDRQLSAALVAFAAALLLSGVAALLDVRDSAWTKATLEAQERQRWLGQGIKDPHSAAHYSIYAFKPTVPLQALDPGIVPFVGEAVWLEAHVQNDLLFRPQQETNAFERMGLVDPAGLFTRFGSLAVLLLAFAAAARERQLGTLALGIACGRRRTYLPAKAASVTAVGALALVGPLILTGAISLATGQHGADDVVRLLVWMTSALAYVGVMAMIAVCLCILARSVQMAFAALLLVWVALVLAAPPAASAVSAWARPLPSFQQMKLRLAREAPAYWTPEAGAEQITQVLRRYGATRESEVTINLRGAQLDVAERHAQEVFDREIGGFYDRVDAQDDAYARLGWLSPAVAFDVISAAAAGTDFAHHRQFIDFAERYRRDLVNRMNADLIPHPAVGGRLHTNDISLWSQIPAFDYEPPMLLTAMGAGATAVIALVAWLMAGAVLIALTARVVRP